MPLVDRIRWNWRRRTLGLLSPLRDRLATDPGERPDIPLERIVAVAQQDADLIADRVGGDISMLSAAEVSVLYTLVRAAAPQDARIAELGTYLGGTTCVFGEALRRKGGKGRIEGSTTSSNTTPGPAGSSPTIRSSTSTTSSRSGRRTRARTPTCSKCIAVTSVSPPPSRPPRSGCCTSTSSRVRC